MNYLLKSPYMRVYSYKRLQCAAFHPNNNYIATGSQDKTVRMWSVNDAKSVRLLQGHRSCVFALAFSPDGKRLASAGK